LYSEEIIRVMKSLGPLLNTSLHERRVTNKDTQLSVEGPLTWRQFHRSAALTRLASLSDPDPVGSGIICGIRIRNSNFVSGFEKDPELKFRQKADFVYLKAELWIRIN